jgi:hypothetical protein
VIDHQGVHELFGDHVTLVYPPTHTLTCGPSQYAKSPAAASEDAPAAVVGDAMLPPLILVGGTPYTSLNVIKHHSSPISALDEDDSPFSLEESVRGLSKLNLLDPTTACMLLRALRIKLGGLRGNILRHFRVLPDLAGQLDSLIPTLLNVAGHYAGEVGTQTVRLVWLQSSATQSQGPRHGGVFLS